MLRSWSPLRIWTGYNDLTIEGETYAGAGGFLGIGEFGEAGDLTAIGAEITLSGISSEVVSLALIEPYQGRACRVMFGVIGVADVVEVFSGLMNTLNGVDSGDTSAFTLLVDSKLVELERARAKRYTHESQQALFPGDTGFSFVADLADKEVAWGRQP
ncbi:hypothetical protein ROLI_040330 [Roseobacter fucihabitans]|uniref:Uncharacterized protein n=1 Tax=Roseobacter fucihabitans TaxID=1537242 RepID=A0ABZ2C005_9RHOB